MTRIAIVDDYQNVALSLADWKSIPGAEFTVFDKPFANEDEIVAKLQGFEIVSTMRERMEWPQSLFARLPDLKLLCITGLHQRLLDQAAATRHGVVVSHTTAGASVPATVELCVALILDAARNVTREDRDMRAGGWQSGLGMTLHGRRLGVVGLGRIGARVAAVAGAFGMELVAWSPNMTAETAAAAGATLVDKETLFRTSDVVTLHLVLGDRSRHIVGAHEFEQMQKHAVLVNTSRGPLIDEAALIDAMRARKIACTALDVYDVEPLPIDHPLRGLDNVVLSPHQGFVTRDVYEVWYGDTVENIRAYLAGAPIRVLNADILKK
ncbi:MAG TPA: D-2-hydroxyacid dehydrogenase family protein [Beijerinckiaceae bacterium]|nr:D-2-hydroxyacid dehydrogenase family protein [Rhodoblastus sp.]MCO5088199.1 D-2-hydroxyacid dehydrogenase family protein [Methylobacteriaceae bacterium]HRY01908.1 D-2-hydroxyacid dehydrogenase family protein [Beijerinckiaceae bacterium]